MENCIRLHNCDTNYPMLVSVDDIAVVFLTMDSSGSRLVSTVYCATVTKIKNFSVNEVPEKIFKMAPDVFIRVHIADSNLIALVNKDYICLIDTEFDNNLWRVKSRIYMNDNVKMPSFVVNESVDKIYNAMSIKERQSLDQPKDQ